MSCVSLRYCRCIAAVQVDPMLTRWLRPHQREGVQFMFDCVCGLRLQGGQGERQWMSHKPAYTCVVFSAHISFDQLLIMAAMCAMLLASA